METAPQDGGLRGVVALRVALVLFVVAWLLSSSLRVVPFWIPFLVALGLELQFFLGSARAPARRGPPDRMPQRVDLERYGYPRAPEELLLVREGDEEVWVPYAGETGEELDAVVEQAREDARRRWEARHAAPPARRGAPLRRFLAGLALVAALAALLWFVDSRSGWDGVDAEARAAAVQRFSAEASRVVGRPVAIRCDEGGDHVGVVQHSDGVATVGGRVAYLTPERCYDLYRLAFEGDVTFSQTARSLAVLAHEAWHLRGVRDEGTTECYALQSAVGIGRRLGLSDGTARQMMRLQLAENTAHLGSTAEYRVPPLCRDGGELDLDPSSSRFP